MGNKTFVVGDLVATKNYSLKDEFIFIWNVIGDENDRELIINLPETTFLAGRFKRVTNKKEYNLFSTYEYAFVKQYDILKRDDSNLGNDYQFLKEIIQTRGPYNFSTELVFLWLLQSLKDLKEINAIIQNDILPCVIRDKHSTLSQIDVECFNADKVSSNLRKAVLPLLWTSVPFCLLKRMKNISQIAERIITEDGRNMLQRLKDDKSLLESLLLLFEKKQNYKSATYSPSDTRKDKPLSHKLNQSFFGAFQEEVENYSKLRVEIKSWENRMYSKGSSIIDAKEIHENLLTGRFPETQQLLFADLGSELPIYKEVNGIESLDYKLAFYIPIFKWMMLNQFHNSMPNVSESDLRKQHIRHIKEFIAGKI